MLQEVSSVEGEDEDVEVEGALSSSPSLPVAFFFFPPVASSPPAFFPAEAKAEAEHLLLSLHQQRGWKKVEAEVEVKAAVAAAVDVDCDVEQEEEEEAKRLRAPLLDSFSNTDDAATAILEANMERMLPLERATAVAASM